MKRSISAAATLVLLSAVFASPGAASPVGERIRASFQKAGQKIKASIERTSEKLNAAGEKIKAGFAQFGEKLKDVGEKIKAGVTQVVDKLKEKIEAFGDKVLDKLKELVTKAIAKVIETATEMIGFKMSDLREVMGEDGKVVRSKVREVVIRRIVSQFLTPMLSEKVLSLLELAWNAIKPAVDGAVSGVIGGVGSIPGVGGVLAGGLHMAYSVGTSVVKSTALKKVGEWVLKKLIKKVSGVLINMAAKKAIEWGNLGLDHLREKWPGIASAMDKVFAGFYEGFESMLKPAGATCAAPAPTK